MQCFVDVVVVIVVVDPRNLPLNFVLLLVVIFWLLEFLSLQSHSSFLRMAWHTETCHLSFVRELGPGGQHAPGVQHRPTPAHQARSE